LAQSFDTAQEIFNNVMLLSGLLFFQIRTGIIRQQSFHLIFSGCQLRPDFCA